MGSLVGVLNQNASEQPELTPDCGRLLGGALIGAPRARNECPKSRIEKEFIERLCIT